MPAGTAAASPAPRPTPSRCGSGSPPHSTHGEPAVHHELITEEEVALRLSRSVGAPFEAFVARSNAGGDSGGKASAKADAKPLWQRLVELKMPLAMIYGREDRANAFERATLLKETYPQIELHIADGCRHMVPWDAADMVARVGVALLRR